MSQKKGVATKSKSNDKSLKKNNYKNYLYACLILVGGIVLALYFYSWHEVKQEEKLMNSYLITSNTIVNKISDLNSLSQIRTEAPSSYFIYLSYTGDEEIYNFEKEIKRVIDKYKLNDIFYYIDITNLKAENENYLEEIAKSLNIKKLEKVPAIIYVYEGDVLDNNILDGQNEELIKIDDLEKLLDVYDFDTVK